MEHASGQPTAQWDETLHKTLREATETLSLLANIPPHRRPSASAVSTFPWFRSSKLYQSALPIGILFGVLASSTTQYVTPGRWSFRIGVAVAGLGAFGAIFKVLRNEPVAPKIANTLEGLQTLESFRKSISRLANQFPELEVWTLFLQYLEPNLDHVRVLKDAVSVASNNNPTSSLVWDLLLAAIRCSCIFSPSIEYVFQRLAILQNTIMTLGVDTTKYSPDSLVHPALLEVFVNYAQYCLILVQFATKNRTEILLQRNGISVKLNAIETKLVSSVDALRQAVARAEMVQLHGTRDAGNVAQHTLLAKTQLTAGYVVPGPPVRSTILRTTLPPENTEFFGRENELNELYERLVIGHKDPKPLPFLLHGRAGLGKTQIARKFSYQNMAYFDAIFWVSADPDKKTETIRTFGNIGRCVKQLQDEDVKDVHIDIVLEWLQNTECRWLLVFDNIDESRMSDDDSEKKSITRYWPTHSLAPSVILMTSQTLMSGVETLEIEALDDDAGSKFLFSQMHLQDENIDDEQRAYAVQISKELGGSPLFISHIQGFMDLATIDLGDCLKELQATPPLSMKSATNWQYDWTLHGIYDNLLKVLSPEAMDLLFMTVFMNPDNISEDLLMFNHSYPELQFLSNRSNYLNRIAELSRGRLVERNTDGTRAWLQIHRTTQIALQHKLSTDLDRRDAAFNRMTRLLREHFPPPSNLQVADANIRPRLIQVLPHVSSALQYFRQLPSSMKGDMFFAELLSDVGGMDLYDYGRIYEAWMFNLAVGEILDALNSPWDTPLRGDSLAIMGICTDFMALSKRDEGLKIRQMQQQIRKACFEKIPDAEVTKNDRIRLYNSYTDLVCSQQQINSFDEVRENLNECLEQYMSWGMEDELPYEYAKYYNQMAYVLLYENRGPKAVHFAKKGYELVQQAAPDTEITALYEFGYANILFQDGKSQEQALEVTKKLLKRSKETLGKENVRTLEIRLNIGIMYYFLGDLKNAEKKIYKTITVGEEKVDLWPPENSTRGRYYLSQVLRRHKNPDAVTRATEMETQAKKELEELLKLDKSGRSEQYRGNDPLLFDYLVHWECRLVTPRQKM